MKNGFLPVTKEEMTGLGWEQPDFVYVCGDAYVDHSSFGHAIIGRVLEAHGYRVAMLPQPDWTDERSVTVFGRPRLGFLVSAGNMDSMVNHYTVNKKPRREDLYSPGGEAGHRPDRATVVYCNLIRKTYKDVPILIGGIEASLRRLGHYDYWSDRMKRSILLDSGADILMYGMGERSIVELADLLHMGVPVSEIKGVRGTCFKARDFEGVQFDLIELPDYAEISGEGSAVGMADTRTGENRAKGTAGTRTGENSAKGQNKGADAKALQKRAYARSFRIQAENTDAVTGKALAEKYGEHRYVIQNPPQPPLTQKEMDEVYDLPYQNTWHPIYDDKGGIPAISEVKFSLTSSRGCFGSCSFCALAFHEGRVVQSRSKESLLKEAERMTKDPEFKGYIHDVGGPTANFRAPACQKQLTKGVCKDRQCLFPDVCKNCKCDHSDYLEVLRALRAIPGVKKVFIRSGIRFDYLMADRDRTFLKELVQYHVSGQLRVAPEHVSDRVLALMGKPKKEVYERFCRAFDETCREAGKQWYVVPYLISSHPGSTLEDAIDLALAVRDMGYMPEQVQDFYPTPSTVSTVMYATGLDPGTMEPVFTEHSYKGKQMQRALIQYRDPKNYDLVKAALLSAGREDLIGYGRECLIPPRPWKEKSGGKTDKKSKSKSETKNSKSQAKKRGLNLTRNKGT